MNEQEKSWPPLIDAAHLPRAVKWRDRVLTMLAWAALAVLLAEEFTFVARTLQALGYDNGNVKPNWPARAERLIPYFAVAIVMAVLLIYFSVRTLQRRSRSLDLPQPAPLEAAVEAQRIGLDERALIAARNQPIVIVHADGTRLRFEAKEARPKLPTREERV
jgi:poly-beta-1,6-N-acetyl-D-glucosamine biosynthesis protein PgaD